jgi:hypothetical protein
MVVQSDRFNGVVSKLQLKHEIVAKKLPSFYWERMDGYYMRDRRRQASADKKNLRQFCYDLIELVPARVMERKYFTFYRDLKRA